jgi:hypothetical protein
MSRAETAAKLLTRDEARRMATNIAKLPENAAVAASDRLSCYLGIGHPAGNFSQVAGWQVARVGRWSPRSGLRAGRVRAAYSNGIQRSPENRAVYSNLNRRYFKITRWNRHFLHVESEKCPFHGYFFQVRSLTVRQLAARRIRSENRTTLLASIDRGRRWLEELVIEPTATAGTIAKREGCTPRKVNTAISLAFLAPDLVEAAIDGTLPHGMGVVRLADLPAECSQQHQMLGLPWS